MEQILVFFNDLNAINIYGLIVVLLLAGAVGFPFPDWQFALCDC